MRWCSAHIHLCISTWYVSLTVQLACCSTILDFCCRGSGIKDTKLSDFLEFVCMKLVKETPSTFSVVRKCLTAKNNYSWVNLVVPKNWVAYFSAISGRKLDLTTVLRSCWPREWRRRGFLASGPFFSLFLTFAHEKNHFPVVKSGFWGHISH